MVRKSHDDSESEDSKYSDPDYEYNDEEDNDDDNTSDNVTDDPNDLDNNPEPAGGYFNKHDEAMHNNIVLILNPSSHHNSRYRRRTRSVSPESARKSQKKYNFAKKYNEEERYYFEQLPKDEKNKIELLENKLIEINSDSLEPLRFKFLKLDIPDRNKKIILSKLDNLNEMSSLSSEYFKLNSWINGLNSIPFCKYYELPVNNTFSKDAICSFLEGVRNKMNTTIYGHKEAKEQIIRILAQLISFPTANGYIIGIQGSAGVGKTKLIKEGICNALNYPYAFISLGGATDASYLRGHSFTYEGAVYGKICESLIKTGVMNPVFLFDELDKVSNTYKGDEIINTLIHITDPVQNDKYTDRYFEEIDLDISRSMVIFTYNDESLINPILKDRMITINVSGYTNTEKLALAEDFLIPEILKQYNLQTSDVIFTKDVIKYIIENVEKEDGVRTLKRTINNIVSWINMMRYVTIDDIKISFPFEVSTKYYDKYCKMNNIKSTLNKELLHTMYI